MILTLLVAGWQVGTQAPDAAQSTSSPEIESREDPLLLSSWGLPEEVVRAYRRRGLERMFPWQLECLQTKGVLSRGRNLVYSAPTSAGENLIVVRGWCDGPSAGM